MAIIFCMGMSQSFAQKFSDAKKASKEGQHALAVKIAAQEHHEKAKDKYAEFLIEEYPLAISEIENLIKTKSEAPLGYDVLATQSLIWVDMYDALKKIPKTLKGKEASITIQIVDYSGKVKEYTAKAIDQNYEAGEKLLASSKIKEKEQGINYFERVDFLNKNKNYKESHKNIVALASSAAKDTMNSGTNVKEKEACISYFEIAEKFGYEEDWKTPLADMYSAYADTAIMQEKLKDKEEAIALLEKAEKYAPEKYKNWKNSIAEIYYLEGKTRIEETTKFKAQEKSIEKYFNEALKYVNPYKDIAELSARVYYDEAEKNSQIKPNYDKMAKAYELYTKAMEYKSDYKDVAEKQAFAKLKKNINLYIVDVDGSVTKNSKFESFLDEKFLVAESDMVLADNASLASLVGQNAVVIKLADNIEIKYTHTPRTTTNKTITRYFAKGDKGWICSTKALNDAGVKNGTLKSSEVKTMSGTKTTVKESAKVTSSFAMEIWDIRGDKPVLLKTKPLSTTKVFTYEVETFDGPDMVKDCGVTLANKRGKIPTEQEAQKYKVESIGEAFGQTDDKKFATFLSKKTKYK
jgi:tetratricopeptide (TPR) repeat protein